MISKVFQRALLLTFLIVPLGTTADDDDFDKIVVFGDSLSDNGNRATRGAFVLFGPPYNFGRLSNGLLAVEVLAEGLALPLLPVAAAPDDGTNFAVAGARAISDHFPPDDLPEQIAAFRSDARYISSEALYVVFIGGNDVRDAFLQPPETSDLILHEAVSEIVDAIAVLADDGAKNFLVANVADLGAIPAIPDPLAGDASELSKKFNRLLAKAIEKLEDDFDIEIIKFNTFRFVRSVIAKADKAGSINTRDACFFSDEYLTALAMGVDPTVAYLDAVNTDCVIDFDPNNLNFDGFVFFDEIHPTAWVHELAGKAMFDLVRDDDDEDDEDDDDD